jgi:uncharacterized protein YutE (UPF0331/DUF86 family)
MAPLKSSQKETILKRLSFAGMELDDLKEFQTITYETYHENRSVRRNVERIIENLINASNDIAKVILAGENVAIPETHREAYLELGAQGIIQADLAAKMADFSRIRNILAHQYLDIRWEMIKNFIESGMEILGVYFDSIDNLISNG